MRPPQYLPREPLQLRPDALTTYQRQSQQRFRALQDAEDDGVLLGFFYGLGAAALAWLLLSGALVKILVTIVSAILHGRGA